MGDRLIELGYEVNRVHFGARAIEEEKYMRRRDEMWGEMSKWFRDDEPQIVDDDVQASDLSGPLYDFDSSQREILEQKKAMKKRGLKSPDDGDGLALTFAVRVAPLNKRNRIH